MRRGEPSPDPTHDPSRTGAKQASEPRGRLTGPTRQAHRAPRNRATSRHVPEESIPHVFASHHGREYFSADEITAAIAEIDAEWRGQPFPAAVRAHWDALNLTAEELRVRTDRVRELARSDGSREYGASFGQEMPEDHGQPRVRRTLTDSNAPHARDRDAALRAVEGRMSDYLSAQAGDRLCSMVEHDRSGADARWLEAISRPEYESAFWMRMMRPESALYEMSPEEGAAMRDALRAEHERALTIGSNTLPLPAAVDPTLTLTSNGAINPLRQLAKVTSINTYEWIGATSAGTTATFSAELTPVTDGTPTLAAPTIFPEKAQMMAQYSIEAGQDYQTLSAEIAKLLADAKDVLEADKFINGLGHASNQPQGLIAGASGTVAAGTASFAIANGYALNDALAPRFQPPAVFLSSHTIANASYRQVAAGNTSEPLQWSPDRARFLGRPWYECSTMTTAVTTGSKIMAYGDIATAFHIVDRAGLSVEPISLMLDTTTNLPTGARGVYAWFRVSSGIVAQSAIKVLQTT